MAKKVLNQKKRQGLQQASFIIFLGISAVILLALLTFSPADPGPFHKDVGMGECLNKAGCKGAWLASFLIGLLGYLAYAVPLVLVFVGLAAFKMNPHLKNPNNPMGGINDVITAVGALFVLLSGTGLANLLFLPYPVDGAIGGGALGNVVVRVFQETFLGYYGSVLFLLSVFLGSITVVADISWGDLAEKVGDKMLQLFEKLQAAQSQERDSTGSGFFERFSQVVQSGKNYLQSGTQSLGKVSKAGASLVNRRVAGNNDAVVEQDDPILGMPDFMDANEPYPQPVVNKEPAAAPVEKPKSEAKVPVENKAEPVAPAAPTPTATKQQASTDVAGELAKAGAQTGMIVLPRLALLNPPPSERVTQPRERLDSLGATLVQALGHYGVKEVKVVAADPGPVITRFELQLPDGAKASKVSGLANDLARNLCVSAVRVVEVIPGRPTIGIEIPNDHRDVVAISEMLSSKEYRKNFSPLTLVLGKDIAGKPVVADLAKMPHLLVAGTTGSGKSVFVNAVLMSLLYKATPDEVRMIMIDPKMLELSSYEDIPHLLAPVVTDMKHAANALRWCVAEMERRYLLMSKLKVRNIAGFNEKVRDAQDRGEPIMDPLFDPTTAVDGHPEPLRPLPYIVVIVDEFADMMMVVGKKVEELIARLAQKARAAGIHLILATQRPSVDVITGLIKANIPTRIAFQVSTKVDSRTILDQGGAEQLLGYGDMLYMPPGTSLPLRVHGALVTDREVEDVANYLKLQGEPNYIAEVLADTASSSDSVPGLEPLDDRDSETDPLYDEAVAVVTESRRASISYLQRRLKVGYNRAARMIEDMEAAGVVSPVLSNGSRDVLAPPPVTD